MWPIAPLVVAAEAIELAEIDEELLPKIHELDVIPSQSK